jgi:hypothetical protein
VQAPGPEIAAARAKRVRSLDPDIACVEREGVAAPTSRPSAPWADRSKSRTNDSTLISGIGICEIKWYMTPARSVERRMSENVVYLHPQPEPVAHYLRLGASIVRSKSFSRPPVSQWNV